MINLKETIVVEGVYDRIKLSSIISSPIIETGGFRIFKDKEKRHLLKLLAAKNGLVILTDSDAAGFKIRNHISSFIPKNQIKNVYVPQILGKEKRKTSPSAEGTIGVEGMEKDIILKALENAGVLQSEHPKNPENEITKELLFDNGFIGGKNSKQKRLKLLKMLNLPEYITTASLLVILNQMLELEEYLKLVKELED